MRDYLYFNVNGKDVKVENPDPELTLASYLRNTLNLTGTKVSCGEGSCGACTVVLGRWIAGSAKYDAINACVTPLFFVDGCLIITVEGIGSKKKLHPLQERIAKGHGTQCGFCSPGFVMAAYALLRNNPNPTKQEIRAAIKGNLCRCTGYRPILEALYSFTEGCCQGKENVCPCKEAKALEKEEDLQLLSWDDFPKLDPSQDLIFPPTLIKRTELASFELQGRFIQLLVPDSEKQLLEQMKEYPMAPIISSGMITGIKKRNNVKTAETWIGTWKVPEFRAVEVRGENVHVGSALSIADFTAAAEQFCNKSISSALIELHDKYSSSKIINQASWAGSVALKGATDVAVLFRTLGVELEVISPIGTKTVKTEEIPEGYVIKSALIPKNMNGTTFFWKAGMRGAADTTIVNCSALVDEKKTNVIFGVKGAFIIAEKVKEHLIKKNYALLDLNKAVDEDFTPIKTDPDYDFSLGLAKAAVFQLHLKLIGDVPVPVEDDEIDFTQIFKKTNEKAIQRPIAHDFADLSTTGEAIFTVDQKLKGSAYLGFVLSTSSHAKFTVDASQALLEPGVLGFYDAQSIPGNNLPGMLSYNTYLDTTPVFATGEVEAKGQPIAVIAAETPEQAVRAAKLVRVSYEPLPAILTLQQAIEAEAELAPTNKFGVDEEKIEEALKNGEILVEGEAFVAGQEHMYLEPQGAWAIPGENDTMVVWSSTQAQSCLQNQCASVLGVPTHKVTIKTKRVGGAFGGKSQQSLFNTATAAIVARDLNKPVASLLNREEDCLITGKRHPILFKYQFAVDKNGKIQAAYVKGYLDGGYSTEHSPGVAYVAAAMFDLCYAVPLLRIETTAMKTNKTSNTAFRGYGNPQVAYAWETIIDHIASKVNKRPEEVREMNFSHDGWKYNTGGVIQTQALKECWEEVKLFSEFEKKRQEIELFNRTTKNVKRGISMSATRFPQTHDTIHEQAAALVQIYLDGSVAVSIGGVEMGQGLYTKCHQVAAKALGIPMEKITIMESSTDKTANSPETGGSQGADIHGKTIMLCAQKLMVGLEPLLKAGKTWEEAVWEAHNLRLPLQASEHMTIDRAHYGIPKGQPTHFTTGAACVIAEVDCISGEHRLLSVDIVMDVGESLNPATDIGQIEGGFMQGYGMLTCEEVNWDEQGTLTTKNFSSYHLPTHSMVPNKFRVKLLGGAPNFPGGVYSSKGIGEPPYMLGTAAFGAILDAIYSRRGDLDKKSWLQVDAPLSRKKIIGLCN